MYTAAGIGQVLSHPYFIAERQVDVRRRLAASAMQQALVFLQGDEERIPSLEQLRR